MNPLDELYEHAKDRTKNGKIVAALYVVDMIERYKRAQTIAKAPYKR